VKLGISICCHDSSTVGADGAILGTESSLPRM
jgi:hypothetical protein